MTPDPDHLDKETKAWLNTIFEPTQEEPLSLQKDLDAQEARDTKEAAEYEKQVHAVFDSMNRPKTVPPQYVDGTLERKFAADLYNQNRNN